MATKTDEKRMEVDWGESQEAVVLKRWIATSSFARPGARIVASEKFDDFDRIVFDKIGLPIAYLEIKVRRSPFTRFGDAIFPARKHKFARQLRVYNLPFVAVTQYGCGTLVEVDLSQEPDGRRAIARRDRPGMTPVPHVLYDRESLTVLEGEVFDGSVC
jgi:hypothetical protein